MCEVTLSVGHTDLQAKVELPWFKTPGLTLSFHEGFQPTPYIKQVASCKSVMPSYYYPAHMASSGCWSNQGQTLTHFRDHLKSTVKCNWTPLEK